VHERALRGLSFRLVLSLASFHSRRPLVTLPNLRLALAAVALLVLGSAAFAVAQTTPYYITAGDQQLMTVLQSGSTINTFAIPVGGYLLAIPNTVWVGHRADAGATQYTLGGTPTGNTSIGGNNFSQLLDGTTNGINNFGVECCGTTNSVTIANLDWSNQAVPFNLPAGREGVGIAFDPTTNHLFVGTSTGTLYEFDLTGNIINTFAVVLPINGLASLAYEAATDTLWSARVTTVFQLNKSGNLLQSFGIPSLGNNFGGEMPLRGIPEPSSLALLASADDLPLIRRVRLRVSTSFSTRASQ
jgi:hypothetical protein